MRLWSIHPKYLDAKGIGALWREGLLAKHVLEGKTKGYTNHPQLIRFKAAPKPLNAIEFYLQLVCEEAERRGYHYDRTKLRWGLSAPKIPVTTGQLLYERKHLLAKLAVRDPARMPALRADVLPDPHPLFEVVEGDIESWERV